MKKIKVILIAACLSVMAATTSFAGAWQVQDNGQWKYQNDDGNYAIGWIKDGEKSYYLEASGVMLINTMTPDGYYVDANGVWDGKPAKIALSQVTSTPVTIIGAGTYKVGTEIAAGEYVLLGNSEYGGYYSISSDSTGDFSSIISNGNFDYNAIVKVENGQYLELTRCTLSPISEIPQIDYTKGELFKIGYHIPAGEYKLMQNSTYSAYYSVHTDLGKGLSDIVTNDNFEGQAYVTVKDGQYLELSRCAIFQ